ncbi:MAG: hypothetical protein H5U19_01475 [Rhodobacteraceae bacterium]|nr:hypothetical protein [Paracoccaceae bacterium]
MAQAESAGKRGAAVGVALNAPAQARPMMRPGRNAPRTTEICPTTLTRAIPDRGRTAMPGSAVVASAATLAGAERDRFLAGTILKGNLPDFLRHLMPVIFLGNDAAGQKMLITLCVTPDYLAVGDDRDYVRVPMGLPAAAQVAERFGFMLPTTRIVDAIYAQADLKLAPQPMPAGPQMRSTGYFSRHNASVEGQSRTAGRRVAGLIAGQKKDLVLSNVLRSHPGRVAIYGWHRINGLPIQPLSTVHGALYADYSHGVRLVSQTAFVDGRPVALADVLADPVTAAILSKEGPIRNADLLMASLHQR